MKKECPLCGRLSSHILQHFAIDHEIEDAVQFGQELTKVEQTRQSRDEFRLLVEKLKEQRARGLISAEDYRDEIVKWVRERENSHASTN